jgi:muramoyltetrapeptide carboxypeptidase LdcA involved in peptidoglycan recycling
MAKLKKWHQFSNRKFLKRAIRLVSSPLLRRSLNLAISNLLLIGLLKWASILKLVPIALSLTAVMPEVISARAEDLHSLWSDDDITAVLPMRGGAGASRILPKLDFSLFEQTPKIWWASVISQLY